MGGWGRGRWRGWHPLCLGAPGQARCQRPPRGPSRNWSRQPPAASAPIAVGAPGPRPLTPTGRPPARPGPGPQQLGRGPRALTRPRPCCLSSCVTRGSLTVRNNARVSGMLALMGGCLVPLLPPLGALGCGPLGTWFGRTDPRAGPGPQTPGPQPPPGWFRRPRGLSRLFLAGVGAPCWRSTPGWGGGVRCELEFGGCDELHRGWGQGGCGREHEVTGLAAGRMQPATVSPCPHHVPSQVLLSSRLSHHDVAPS